MDLPLLYDFSAPHTVTESVTATLISKMHERVVWVYALIVFIWHPFLSVTKLTILYAPPITAMFILAIFVRYKPWMIFVVSGFWTL